MYMSDIFTTNKSTSNRDLFTFFFSETWQKNSTSPVLQDQRDIYDCLCNVTNNWWK